MIDSLEPGRVFHWEITLRCEISSHEGSRGCPRQGAAIYPNASDSARRGTTDQDGGRLPATLDLQETETYSAESCSTLTTSALETIRRCIKFWSNVSTEVWASIWRLRTISR